MVWEEISYLLISSYLDERKQFVSLGGYESTCKKSEVGVPQSLVSGPLLFIIHIYDLQNSRNVLNFADDISFTHSTFTKDTYLMTVKILTQN